MESSDNYILNDRTGPQTAHMSPHYTSIHLHLLQIFIKWCELNGINVISLVTGFSGLVRTPILLLAKYEMTNDKI